MWVVIRMGAKLAAYFDKASKKGGIPAKVKLAMMTGMSDDQAKSAEDSEENIKKFEDAMGKL